MNILQKRQFGGANIVLTIDANLQRIAEQSLANNIEKIRAGGFGDPQPAEGGAVVVTNCKTGEIIAMASNPDFEPALFYNGISQDKFNEYINNPFHPLYSKAYQSNYAPGSTFKMVTAIAGLETGTITPTTRINDNGPYYGITDDTVQPPSCWYFNEYHRGHGWLNVTQAIEKSCNYFFYDTGVKVGIDQLDVYARYFGLGGKTGIELTGETSGVLAQRSLTESKNFPWTAAQTAYASIGQGYNSFSPVQMSKYIAMVANGGHKLDLSIVKSVNLSNGTQVSKTEIDEFINKKLGLTNEGDEDIVISDETMRVVLNGMRAVTEGESGTARSVFRDFSISVGGKTGSAETAVKTKTNAWFVGFAPFDDPEIAVVVMVENGLHGWYTAEVVKDIVYEYFGMNIPIITEDMSAISETEIFR